ncbi:MAG: hydantoinase/oxoprolinase family protein, partial [Candidatus Poribacteria bacterium]|nr:hydantoinase/oxoprolinase family protein [Candidatus Poribacteria bacterium]
MRIGIDIGGTFTDFVLYDETSGELSAFKRLSTPRNPALSVLSGIAELDADAPPSIIHGSTVATNTLLERKGARTAFVTTRGFRDLLSIARQTRENIYDFFSDRPAPLVPRDRAFEITERVASDGQLLQAMNEAEIVPLIDELRECGAESVAVCLLFSFLRPEHEARLGERLRAAGFLTSLSHEVLPEFREYERASTTTVNAYVAPILDRYLSELESKLTARDFRIMQSNGGSIHTTEARRHAVRSILSGPAGGCVGALHIAKAVGFERVITFDMGGTSTDVSLALGAPQITSEAEIAGLPIRIPVIHIHTIGAGGGSIAYVDAGGALRVGPESAGSDPGPCCYGQGGWQPTVTDANVVLGRLDPQRFLGGAMTLDSDTALDALIRLANDAGIAARDGLNAAQSAALGVIEIANAHMERALRVISVSRGHDPRDFAFVSFGGAGGLHAVELARNLGVETVLVPYGASTLSAFGMLVSDVVKDYAMTVMLAGSSTKKELETRFQPMTERARRETLAERVSDADITIARELDCRYRGQSFELTVPFTESFASAFHAAHEERYGHADPMAPIEIVNLRVRAIGKMPTPPLPKEPLGDADPSSAFIERRPVVVGGVVKDTPS